MTESTVDTDLGRRNTMNIASFLDCPKHQPRGALRFPGNSCMLSHSFGPILVERERNIVEIALNHWNVIADPIEMMRT